MMRLRRKVLLLHLKKSSNERARQGNHPADDSALRPTSQGIRHVAGRLCLSSVGALSLRRRQTGMQGLPHSLLRAGETRGNEARDAMGRATNVVLFAARNTQTSLAEHLPQKENCTAWSGLKRCKEWHIFFDFLFCYIFALPYLCIK